MLDSNLYDNTPFYILKNIVGLVERFLNLELKQVSSSEYLTQSLCLNTYVKHESGQEKNILT